MFNLLEDINKIKPMMMGMGKIIVKFLQVYYLIEIDDSNISITKSGKSYVPSPYLNIKLAESNPHFHCNYC
jgi:hypothetical protein